MNPIAAWPPLYTVRISQRARHARLHIAPGRGLEVVLPKGMAEERARQVLDSQRDWVKKHLRQALALAAPESPPETIRLPAIGQTLAVRRQATGGDTIQLHEMDAALYVDGRTDDDRAMYAVLRRWLKRKAKAVLTTWLARVSREIALPYRKLTVRLQRGRWGSCTAQGHISLNAKLLLVEPILVRHVLVHELCHTVHLNHSPAFWALVARHDPDWVRLRKTCRARWRDMPGWVGARS